MTEQKTMSSVLIGFWPVSSLWYGESPDTHFQSCLLRYQETHSDLVLIKSSGSSLPHSLKSFNFITATGVPQGAALDPLLFLYTKLLDEGSDLMASTTSMSMAQVFLFFFPLHLATPQVLGRWLLFGQLPAICLNMKEGLGAFSRLRTLFFSHSQTQLRKLS